LGISSAFRQRTGGTSEELAINIALPKYLIKRLSRDKSKAVQSSIGLNPNTPTDILVEFSKKPCVFYRLYVAENINTPPEVLEVLAQDNGDSLSAIDCDEEPFFIRPTTSKDIRLNIAENSSTPKHVIKELCKDEDIDVANMAKNKLVRYDDIRRNA